jgi:hypothetical protein
MHRRSLSYFLAMLAILSGVAHAAEQKDFAGTWVMRLGDRNMFVLMLAAEGADIRGSWDRPMKYASTNGAFSNMHGGVRRDAIVRSRLSDGVLHFTVQSVNDPKDEDTYAMTVNGDHATLVFDDIPPGVVVAPRLLERVAPGAKAATDWEPNRLYTPNDSDIPNAEMNTIFAEDQRVRMASDIDWKTVNRTDAERREQTRKLLAAGALHTAKDYEEAAFVFQHGDMPEDYLLAHTLAMVAVSKGDSTAIWIASATLDRYLEKIGQKQIFGTQFSSDSQHHWTQEPYDRNLVSDAIRQQLAVPTQTLQEEQLKAYQAQK